MSGDKLSHYFPGAEWSWSSEGDYSTLEWFGPGDKPTEQEIAGLAWPAPTAREKVKTSRANFAMSAYKAGLVTAAEAEAWAGGTSLPQIVTDAFDANIPDASERLAARINALTAPNIHRTNPFILILQQTMKLTDEQVDGLFVP